MATIKLISYRNSVSIPDQPKPIYINTDNIRSITRELYDTKQAIVFVDKWGTTLFYLDVRPFPTNEEILEYMEQFINTLNAIEDKPFVQELEIPRIASNGMEVLVARA